VDYDATIGGKTHVPPVAYALVDSSQFTADSVDITAHTRLLRVSYWLAGRMTVVMVELHAAPRRSN